MNAPAAPLPSGIYSILNKVTHHCYIGQASKVRRRFRDHWGALKAGNHPNPLLQQAVNRYGIENFSFNVVERCPISQLNDREYDWMVKVRPNYNRRVPDFAAIARGRNPRRILRVSRNPANNQPSRWFCQCGQLKSIGSRWCLGCNRTKLREMEAAGYLIEVPEDVVEVAEIPWNDFVAPDPQPEFYGRHHKLTAVESEMSEEGRARLAALREILAAK